MQGHYVGLPPDLVQLHISRNAVQRRIQKWIMYEYAAAKSVHDASEGRADFTGTHYTYRFAVQIKSHQPVQGVVVLPDPIKRAMNIAIQGQNQTQGMLSYGMW